jgi:hypothetical protein
MSAGEGIEWRRWVPKVGDMVLVELPDDRIWPGKVRHCEMLSLTTDYRSTYILSRSHNAEGQSFLPGPHIFGRG